MVDDSAVADLPAPAAVALDLEEPAVKRLKVESSPAGPSGAMAPAAETMAPPDGTAPTKDPDPENTPVRQGERRPGIAPIKKDFLLDPSSATQPTPAALDDDEAEGRRDETQGNSGREGKKDKKNRKKPKGQNVDRTFGKFDDAIHLCNSRAFYPEFSPRPCRFGDQCKLSHDLRKYLREGRREDVDTFGGQCPVFAQHGSCPSGWKCRFVKSHMREIERDDGRMELVLVDGARDGDDGKAPEEESEESRPGVYNVVPMSVKMDLSRKRLDFAKADEYIKWINHEAAVGQEIHHHRKDGSSENLDELRARYTEPPFRPSEKRRLYFGPETPALAPLTTQGNLPFRRLCVQLGAQVTYSEMAMAMPLLQGSKSDWTLIKAHQSELSPPRYTPRPGSSLLLDGYDHARDLRFGAQLSAHQPWVAIKAANALSRFCPHLRLVDLNCGCPIDMIFKSGGGSALLESQGKMERIIRGMNALSGEIPITAKIRTGVKSSRPVATQTIERLALGSRENRDRLGAPGCAAITLHGRSREQRYTKTADWSYIAECAALVKSFNDQLDGLTDTAGEPDARSLPNAKDGRIYFLGNGDCFSHLDYQAHLDEAAVDSVMIGRGALIKPWIFEEIEKGQYLDKSSSERLTYIEQFVRYGLEAWGSDELGIGFTRRFLLEWLSFAHRYVPLGLLEHLPPSLNDRPPAFVGRDDLETLMASANYKDWIKISEMFLGPVQPGFQFQPKHKSNAYEAEG